MHERGHHIETEIDWSENCRRSGITFIDHAVARSRFMAALEVARQGRKDIELLHASDIIAHSPEATRTARQPLKWVTSIPGDDGRMFSASVIADDLFALRFDDDTESYFLVEIDRGQMPVRRFENLEEIAGWKRRLRTHYMHKLATYWHGSRSPRRTIRREAVACVDDHHFGASHRDDARRTA